MIIQNGRIITPFESLDAMQIRVGDDGKISDISKQTIQNSENENVIDAKGYYVCPGFVDIHTHGGGGSDFMDATIDDFSQAMKFHSNNGTTALLATSVCATREQTITMLNIVREQRDQVISGCRLLGANLEGPFISKKNRGAQLIDYIMVPEEEGLWLYEEYKDVVLMTTLSPELKGATRLIHDLVEMGIVVSGGHDDADDVSIKRALEAGMTHTTHLFCAMSSIEFRNRRRNVGLSTFALIDDRLSVELIADLYHLPPDLVRLAYQCKGPQKACLVSDCMRAGGMPPDGKLYILGPRTTKVIQNAIVTEGVASLPDRSHYAGSITPVGKMVKNLVTDCGISLNDAVRMATDTPARLIHKDKCVGRIAPGLHADFCFLDQDYNVVRTIVGGKTVFCRE